MRRFLKQVDWRGWLIVTLLGVVAVWPLLMYPSLPQETDAELHIFRLHELMQLVAGGEFYPRWAPNFYHGYGYPIFNYYAPLTYYVAMPLAFVAGPVAGVKAVFVLGVLLVGWGLFGFVKGNWSREAGFVVAVLGMYAPYIQYIDPIGRGVLAESFSFGLFACALWVLDEVRRGGGRGWWGTAVLLIAALILSHNLMALLLFGMMVAWVIVGQFTGRVGRVKTDCPAPTRWQQTGWLLGALALGVGVAAFFWLPVFLERNAVNLNTLIGEGDNFDFRTHFLSLREMLAPSLLLDWGATEPQFRFNVGLAQWVLALLGVAVWARTRERGTYLFFVLAVLVLFFLQLPVSTLLWETIPVLPYFQFPWRLLGATAVCLAILSAPVAHALKGYKWATPALVSLIVLLGMPLSQPAPWPDFGAVTNERMTEIEWKGRWLGTTSTADFVPATVDMIPERNGTVVAGFYEGDGVLDRVNEAVIPETTTVQTEQVRPLLTRYTTNSATPFKLRLFLFDFPGWQARVDGEPVQTELGRPEGFLVVPVPAGEHVVEVEFGSTTERTLSWWVSGLSLLLLLGLAFVYPSPTQGGDLLIVSEGDDKWMAGTAVLLVLLFAFVIYPLGWLRYQSADFVAQPAQTQTRVNFGDQMALIGVDLSDQQVQAGDEVTIGLYWQAQREMEINYQVFVHLLPPAGAPALAQSDKLNPGAFPTRRWPLDKYVYDEHTLTIPPDLPAGTYMLSVGLWVQTEGWRLPIFDETGAQIGDNHPFAQLQVK